MQEEKYFNCNCFYFLILRLYRAAEKLKVEIGTTSSCTCSKETVPCLKDNTLLINYRPGHSILENRNSKINKF